MAGEGFISFKIYFKNEGNLCEIRRFGIEVYRINYSNLLAKLAQVFPKLEGKLFNVYWKDEDCDDVIITSDDELDIALTTMKSDVKKLYVTVKNPNPQFGNNELHSGVLCDGCEGKISGFRYKCIVCPDFDLCQSCEENMVHFEHAMLRIPNPHMFERHELQKLFHLLSRFVSNVLEKFGHHHFKKRRLNKRDSHRCPGKGLFGVFESCPRFSDDTGYFEQEACSKKKPSHCNPEPASEPFPIDYLKNIGKNVSTILKDFGIDVELEIRSKNSDNKEEKINLHNNKEEKINLHNDKEEKINHDRKQEESTSNGSDSQQKGVRFTDSDKVSEILNAKVNEITNILSKQKVNESPEKEDWVSFEELKRSVSELETPPEEAKTASTAPQMPQQAPSTSSAQESQNLYPSLKSPLDVMINQSLEKMLAMGFSNEGNWLRQLLEAKKGDISQVVEALSPHKK